MIKELLKIACENKKLIGITTDKIEWDESIIGYVIEMNDVYIRIDELDEYGANIGNTLILIDDILHVEPQNWYIRNLQFILENNLTFDSSKRVTIWERGEDLIPHWKHLKEISQISQFYFENDNFVIGIILDFDSEYILINNIGQDGSDEGNTCYRIKDIIGLRYGDLSEQKIKLLHDNSKKGNVSD